MFYKIYAVSVPEFVSGGHQGISACGECFSTRSEGMGGSVEDEVLDASVAHYRRRGVLPGVVGMGFVYRNYGRGINGLAIGNTSHPTRQMTAQLSCTGL